MSDLPTCPHCLTETPWTQFGDDLLHHSDGHLCLYVPFGPVARIQIGIQCQCASRYVTGQGQYPNLGEGLRFRNISGSYHNFEIHRDDVDTFVTRVNSHRHETQQF